MAEKKFKRENLSAEEREERREKLGPDRPPGGYGFFDRLLARFGKGADVEPDDDDETLLSDEAEDEGDEDYDPVLDSEDDLDRDD